jgi:hypothetical protein
MNGRSTLEAVSAAIRAASAETGAARAAVAVSSVRGTIDLTTGIITPIVTGLVGPGGLMFVDTSKHGWPDWKRDDNACRDDRE